MAWSPLPGSGIISAMEAGVVVVGGGAAGLLAAASAASRLRAAGSAAPVVVLEAAREPGRKVLVSGGGRCNVLPGREARERFVSSSPRRLVDRFLDRFPLAAQRAFFEGLLGAPLREEESGKLFPPTNRARDVRDALVALARSAGAEVRLHSPVREVAAREGGFDVRLDAGTLSASAVVLATGGRSVLAGGADAAGFDWAAAFGHSVRPLVPALVPLTGSSPAHAALSGVALEAAVTARCGSETAAARGGFLFTHRGWSGPAVLDVSHVVTRALAGEKPFSVVVSFGGDAAHWDETLRAASGSVLSLLRRSLPDRVASLLLAEAGVAPETPLHRMTREARRAVVAALSALPLPVGGSEGYRTAEVTAGGVALEEVDPGSGASRLVPGLFLAGEILDAVGPIGGFNFQWAWATGRTAGEGAARAVLAGG
ncbi:MAG TPA: aminoacetone oxidase family FAD-binding enzyme [Thermoanaerobaculia bacterium]|nr:aminoacetone oxidase family FAD-binding enzyme [Thermoanaerobaculia bacterium]